MRKTYKRKCKTCKEDYTAKVKTSKTCSNKCRQALWLKNSKKHLKLEDEKRISNKSNIELLQGVLDRTKGMTGKAPCVKFCEATAFRLEMAKLETDKKDLQAKLDGVIRNNTTLKNKLNDASNYIGDLESEMYGDNK